MTQQDPLPDNVLQFHSAAEYDAKIAEFCRWCVGDAGDEAIARCDHLCPFWQHRPVQDGHEWGTVPDELLHYRPHPGGREWKQPQRGPQKPPERQS